MTIDRLTMWFADHSPGEGKAITVSGHRLTTGAFVGLGSGFDPTALPTLAEPGDTIPAVGDTTGTSPISGMTRAEIFVVFKRAVGFSSNEAVYGWTAAAANSLSCSLSCWVNFGVQTIVGWTPVSNLGSLFNLNSVASSNALAFITGGDTFYVPPDGLGPSIEDLAIGSGGTITYPLDGTTNAGWVHMMYAAKITSGVGSAYTLQTVLYTNDNEIVNTTDTLSGNHGAFPFNTASGHDAMVGGGWGDNVAPVANGLYGAVAEYWLKPSFVDWSDANNRAKFHIKSLALDNYAPCNLGSTGTGPGLGTPLLYLRGNHLQFPINRVTGQSLTVDGTLIDVDTPPDP